MAHRCTLSAPIVMADRTQQKSGKHYWLIVSGQHCLLAERDTGALIFKKGNQTEQFVWPCLFSCQLPINWSLPNGDGNKLRKRRRKHEKETDIDRHGSSNICQPPKCPSLFITNRLPLKYDKCEFIHIRNYCANKT
jgi:hypothetical protein